MLFLRLGARILSLRRLSFGATYIVALIVGGTLILAGLVVDPLLAGFHPVERKLVSVIVALGISGWLVGYFMTTVEGKSVGFRKGVLLVTLASAMFGLLLLAVVAVVVGVLGASKT